MLFLCYGWNLFFCDNSCVDEDNTKKDGLSQVHCSTTTYELVPLPARKKQRNRHLRPDLKKWNDTEGRLKNDKN